MEPLRELVLRRAEELKVELKEAEIDRVLRDLLRWTERPRRGEKVLKTQDGSHTLWSDLYGEPYHSLTAGAVREALEKFVIPSRVVERARKRAVRILDVGFGLGYNVAVALFEIRKANPKAEVEVVSLEKEVPDSIPLLPEPYSRIHRLVLDLLPEGEREGFRIKLLLGDARARVRDIAALGAEAVFHDPFSPFKNPDMWSLEFLEKVKLAMSPEGYWVSYTSALPVRRALRDLGFKVGQSRPVGRRRGGTVATLKGDLKPLDPEEEKRLLTSPFSLPFRDPDLKRDPLEILIDYRLSVLQREREPFSERAGGRPTRAS